MSQLRQYILVGLVYAIVAYDCAVSSVISHIIKQKADARCYYHRASAFRFKRVLL